MSFSKRPKSGFSVVELVMTLVVVAILARMSMTYFGGESNTLRFEATRAKVDVLRKAILGDDTIDNEGRRKNFGYHGDMGKLPATLSDLVTQGSQPAWTYQTYHGFGVGWRGPYVQSGFTGGPAVTLDEWGKTFVYNTASNPPSLSSPSASLSTQFPSNERLATVKGIAAMNDIRLVGHSIQIRYPGPTGALTFNTQVTDGNGYFSFSSIPFGVRSLAVVGPGSAKPPIPIVVDTSDYQIPPSLLNLGQTVLFIPGTANSTGTGDEIVQAAMRSSYTQSLQLEAITFSWTNGASTGYVKQFQMGGTYQAFTPVATGSRVTFTNLLSLPSQEGNVNIQLWLSANPDGSGTFDTDGYTFTLTFEWKGIPNKQDTIVFTVS